MPRIEIELLPVDQITADAIGPKGQRVFYLQATKDNQVVTLITEKFQIQSLAVGIEQFLVEVLERYPDIPEASADYNENHMRIQPPVDPLFRLQDVGLGYNVEDDLVVLVIHELLSDDSASSIASWTTLFQAEADYYWARKSSEE